jgi:hypothetical protein
MPCEDSSPVGVGFAEEGVVESGSGEAEIESADPREEGANAHTYAATLRANPCRSTIDP